MLRTTNYDKYAIVIRQLHGDFAYYVKTALPSYPGEDTEEFIENIRLAEKVCDELREIFSTPGGVEKI